MEQETRQFLIDKFTKKWLKENKDMLADYGEICNRVIMFHFMWGIEIGVVLKNPQESKGRGFGKSYSPKWLTEELFDAQKTINKIEKYSKERFRKMTDEEIKTTNEKPFFNIYKVLTSAISSPRYYEMPTGSMRPLIK